MYKRAFFTGFFFVLLHSMASASGEPVIPFRDGRWSGDIEIDSYNSAFKACWASTNYSDGTKRLPAFAGRILDVLLQVLKYDIFRDGTVGGRKIPPAPKSLPPIPFLQCRELPLYQVRGTPLDLPHEVADRKLRRDRDKHVHVIT